MNELIRVSDDLNFCLANSRISYLLRVSAEGILEHVHFGGVVTPDALAAQPRRAFRACSLEFQGVPNYDLSDTPQEYPLFGTSDRRHPALHLINADGNSTNTFLYQSHNVLDRKPVIEGLPTARGVEGGSETLIVTLTDKISRLRVDLHYTVYREHDVIARSAVIHNDGGLPVELLNIGSSCLDLPAADYDLLYLTGSWGREFKQQRMPVPAGRLVLDSASGVSSNAHHPFVAIMDSEASEHAGKVYATALLYSGNFAINVEKGEFDSVRVSAGINPFNFRWQLEKGESFRSPESLQVFSSHGLNGMSQSWHRFIQQQISPRQHSQVARPTYLNSWEALYFNVNDQEILALAETARAMGLEMLVVDDGWFAGRNNDSSSLGDWFSDPAKFPDGVEAVAAKVKVMGLKFGLWFEPEMINERSQLFADHPDWIIHVPGRPCSTGRQQMVLDLSRAEVVEYLYQRLDAFLSCGDIDYVKWDMNRVMTEIGSAGLGRHQQLETPHRYMLGVYRLISRLVEKYPQVLFENCASGGNRFDLGMLRYMSQGWVSDMSEPIGRLPIINGASYLFPPSVLASYIGPVPSHQNGRLASIKTRAEVGFFCAARGLSLSIADIDSNEVELKATIELYKRSARDLVTASFHRIIYNANEVCWQLISADQKTIYLGYFHILSAPNLPYRRARLVGLQGSARYRLKSNGDVYAGDSLMHMGLDLPYVHAMQLSESTDYMEQGDFASRLLVFSRI